MDDSQVAAYLARIGATRVDSLGDLQEKHLVAVPFENLSIHLDEPVVLDSDALFDKVVTRRRGGFCYELNGLFAELLRALDYDVTMLAASVYDGRGGLGPPFDHLCLVVDDHYLVDVGFGRFAGRPLRLDTARTQHDAEGRFKVRRGSREITVFMDDQPQYVAERWSRELADFIPTCWWQTTSPDSHFTQRTVCTRRTPDGRVTISDGRLVVTDPSGRFEEEVSDLVVAYSEHFGITIDRAPVRKRLRKTRKRARLPSGETGPLS